MKSNPINTLLFTFLALIITADTHAQMAVSNTTGEGAQIKNSYVVRELAVDANIRNQIAEVNVTQVLYNQTARQMEIEIYFPLPEQSTIQSFLLMVDGNEIPGMLMPKEEATRIYQGIVRAKKDPALLEYVGYGLFKTSVFPVPARTARTITLRYVQVCKKSQEMVEFSYPFSTQKYSSVPLQKVSMNIRIESKEDIKSIYCPSDQVDVSRNGNKKATVKMDYSSKLPDRDFQLIYTTSNGTLGASLMSYMPPNSSTGYFLLLASPEVKRADVKPAAKSVVFILDRSGSMSGNKIEQAREATRFIISNLNDGDKFNIIAYDDAVGSLHNNLKPVSQQTRREAVDYIDRILAGGGTNINGALMMGASMINDRNTPSYIIFLTDGLPTTGIVNELQINDNFTKANKNKARLFAFGVGDNVNARLLDRLSSQNGGTSEYVRPGEDIESKVSALFRNMTVPALTDMQLSFDSGGIDYTYPSPLPDLFDGGQIVAVGKYSQHGKTTARITGKNEAGRQHFQFPVQLARSNESNDHAFIAKIWATRRIGHLINQIDLNGKNPELVGELVKLSKEYGILTPYTSFLAREDVDIQNPAQLQSQTQTQLRQLEKVSGKDAVDQRVSKNSYMAAAIPTEQEDITVGEVTMSRTEIAGNVKNMGSKTFYKRDKTWIEGTLTRHEISNATVIKQMTDPFFKLNSQLDAQSNQYLAMGEDVVVKLNGNVYRITK
jgi:Ca-activated chloride channel homolog